VSRFLAINIEGKIGELTVRRTSSFIMTPNFSYTSENKTKCTILYKKFRFFNDRIFRYSRILRRIYTFHIQSECIIIVEDLNALYLEN
jgi:hypothetical protein